MARGRLAEDKTCRSCLSRDEEAEGEVSIGEVSIGEAWEFGPVK